LQNRLPKRGPQGSSLAVAEKKVKFEKDDNLSLRGMALSQLSKAINLLLDSGFTGTITVK